MTAPAATLTPREVAELSGAPKRLVEKAIEERVLTVRRRAPRRGRRSGRRMLPAYAVAYAAVMAKLGLSLNVAQKKQLAGKLASLTPREVGTARVELAPAVELDVGRLAGKEMDRAEAYRAARDQFIVSDEEIMGGTPVIRGTRQTVYSIQGRVDHGDPIEDILEEYPDLTREMVEAAITYARAHPFVGRPGGRPWLNAK